MDGIDKLLDKIGFYNLVGVLLPGILATSFSILVNTMFSQKELAGCILKDNIFFFIIVSYFVGVVLQEIGSFIMKLFDRGNKILINAIEAHEGRRDSISARERLLYESAIQEVFSEASEPSWAMMYNFCKYSGGNSLSADKD